MAILKPGAQLGVLADRPQALVGLLGEDAVRRMEQVGVGPLAAPAYPAPDLVQLAQAEQVGPVDDERVDRGHVDPRLNDGRAHQHVVATLPEVEHHGLEAALVHLAVGDRHPGLGDHGADVAGDPVDVRHAVVHVEGLPLAQHLAAERLADRRGIVLPDVGEDRPPVGRRRVDHGEVADARQRHLQRARDGAGGERQHVDALGHALDGLLVGHPEALFLVDHQDPELLELDVLGQQAVRADDHVDAPVGQSLHDLALLRPARGNG